MLAETKTTLLFEFVLLAINNKHCAELFFNAEFDLGAGQFPQIVVCD